MAHFYKTMVILGFWITVVGIANCAKTKGMRLLAYQI